MKIFLTSILILFSIFSYSQTDTTAIKPPYYSMTMISSKYGRVYGDYQSGNRLTFWMPDSQIEIRGDTISVIKILLKEIQRGDSIEMSLYQFMGAAVRFTNNLPDYFKTPEHNKSWREYYKALRRNGFIISKK